MKSYQHLEEGHKMISTHFNMFYNAALTADRLCRIGVQDVSLAVLPLFHAFGQTCVMNATLYAGGTLTLLRRFEPDLERFSILIFTRIMKLRKLLSAQRGFLKLRLMKKQKNF